MKPLADRLWKLAHDSFEGNVNVGVFTGLASFGAGNQKQADVLGAIAALGSVSPGDEAAVVQALSTVRGEILTAEAAGWLAPDTARHMLGLLDAA